MPADFGMNFAVDENPLTTVGSIAGKAQAAYGGTMSQISNGSLNTSRLDAINQIQNQPLQKAPQGTDPAPVKSTMPNPQKVLMEAKRRFPDVSTIALQGRDTYMGDYNDKQFELGNLARNLGTDKQAPLLIGSGKQHGVSLMPTKGIHGPDKAGKIQALVVEGKKIFDQVMQGDFTKTPSKHDVAKVMWFLQSLASSKAAPSCGNRGQHAVYKEGSMNVEDPNGRLHSFLSRANSYSRTSSHMEDYQSLGDQFKPRGVDIRKVPLPNKMKTVMFARMPKDDQIPPGSDLKGTGTKQMLFIKMEDHGIPGVTAKGSGTPREPGVKGSKFKSFKRFFSNLGQSILHGLGFVRSKLQRAGVIKQPEGNNKERIPSDVKTLFTNLQNDFAPDKIGTDKRMHRAAELLNAKNPLSDSGGIKRMVGNIENALAELKKNPAPSDAQKTLIAKLTNALTLLKNHGDHPDMRIGNEIILTREDTDIDNFTPASRSVYSDGAKQIAGKLTWSKEQGEVTLAGLDYKLAAAATGDNETINEQYRKDVIRGDIVVGGMPCERNEARTSQALERMAGGNQNLLNAFKLLLCQTYPQETTQMALIQVMNTNGANIDVNCLKYNLSRLPDGKDGEQVFSISYSLDKNKMRPEVVDPDNKLRYKLDIPKTVMDMRYEIRLTVGKDGSIRTSLPFAPTIQYTLTRTDDAPTRTDAPQTRPKPPTDAKPGGKTEQPKKPEQTGQTGKTEQPKKPEQTVKTEQPTKPEQKVQTVKIEQPKKTGQTEQIGTPSKTGPAKEIDISKDKIDKKTGLAIGRTYPGVRYATLAPGQALPGTRVPAGWNLDKHLAQGDSTCFITSIARGMCGSQEGRAFLANRVHQDQNNYYVRLKQPYGDEEYCVTVPKNLLSQEPADGSMFRRTNRPEPMRAIECAIELFMINNGNVGGLDAVGDYGEAGIAAMLLGLEQVYTPDTPGVDPLADLPQYIEDNLAQNHVIIYRPTHQAHFITVEGLDQERGELLLGDSMQPNVDTRMGIGEMQTERTVYNNMSHGAKTNLMAAKQGFMLDVFKLPEPQIA
jgi:hypothetical protein